MDENSGTFGSKELASPRRIGLVDLNNERGAGMVTNKQVLELDMVLGKYVGSSNGMMPPQEAERRAARTARVSRFAKFSYGLARNIGIIRPAVQAYQEAMKLDEVEAYQGAVKALQSEKLEGEEFEKRLAELNKEHDVDGTGTSIYWKQFYYDAVTPAVSDAAKVSYITNADWTSTASTRNGYLSISPVVDGVLTQMVKIGGSDWSAEKSVLEVSTGSTAGSQIGASFGGIHVWYDVGNNYTGYIDLKSVRTDSYKVRIQGCKTSAAGNPYGLYILTDQTVEDIGVYVPTKKIRLWYNDVEYWIQLDPV